MTLSAPDRAELSSDYHNGKPPIVKTGTWQAKPGGAITVTLPEAPARPEAKAEVLRFQLQGDALSALAYDMEAWGKEGLRLVKKGGAGATAGSGGAAGGSAGSAAKLRGTLWRLVELRGADGAVVKPDDPEKYTFELNPTGASGSAPTATGGWGATRSKGAR